MEGVTFDIFLTGLRDVEATQYRILAYLQGIRDAFSKNAIYPHLGELVELHKTLDGVAGRLADAKDALPGRLTGVDLKAHRLIYEKSDLGIEQLDDLEALIQWVLPQIREAIEEGKAIFEFVDENLTLEHVGIVPSYVEEGYLLVPDRGARQIHVVRYRMSIFTGADERFRTLRTSHVKSIDFGYVQPSPIMIKQELVASHTDEPNPSTYFLTTELDFPFRETVLPVAKRKLIQNLSSGGVL
jgi:hypothetical protein